MKWLLLAYGSGIFLGLNIAAAIGAKQSGELTIHCVFAGLTLATLAVSLVGYAHRD